MKRLIFISLIFILSEFCFAEGDTLKLLSLRTDYKIDQNTRNYFGLFPMIEKFEYAELYKNNEGNFYFKIKSDNDILNLNISDSVLNELKFFISNHEDLIDQGKNIKNRVNKLLKPDFVKVNVYLNTKKESINIKLVNNLEILERWPLYINDSLLIVAKSNNLDNLSKSKFNIEIYYFNEIEYFETDQKIIIAGEKQLFNILSEKLEPFLLYSDLSNRMPVEIKRIIASDTLNTQIKYSPKYDLNKIYNSKYRFGVSFGFSDFTPESLPLFDLIENKYKYNLIFNSNFLMKIFIEFQPIDQIGIALSYKNQKLNFKQSNVPDLVQSLTQKEYTQFCNGIGIQLNYLIAYSGKYLFSLNQYNLSTFIKLNIDKYSKIRENSYQLWTPNFWSFISIASDLTDKYDFTSELKYSYEMGIKIDYKHSQHNFFFIQGSYIFHNDLGIINTMQLSRTRYINYISSLAIDFGFGANF